MPNELKEVTEETFNETLKKLKAKGHAVSKETYSYSDDIDYFIKNERVARSYFSFAKGHTVYYVNEKFMKEEV